MNLTWTEHRGFQVNYVATESEYYEFIETPIYDNNWIVESDTHFSFKYYNTSIAEFIIIKSTVVCVL